MLMFTFHVAFALLLAVFGGGALLWHTASRAGGSIVLRVASVVLVAGSVLSIACLGYFAKQYNEQGAFENAYARTARPMGMGGMNMMRPGMMGPGARNQNRMPRPMNPNRMEQNPDGSGVVPYQPGQAPKPNPFQKPPAQDSKQQ